MTSGWGQDHIVPPLQQSHRQQQDLHKRLHWWMTARDWALCSESWISVWGVLALPSFTLERKLWSLWSCCFFGCCSGFWVFKPLALLELFALLSFISRNNGNVHSGSMVRHSANGRKERLLLLNKRALWMSFKRITLICGSLCFGIFMCGYAQEWLKILRGFALDWLLLCLHRCALCSGCEGISYKHASPEY